MNTLIVEGRVIRARKIEPGKRVPKAVWVLHVEDCKFAPGCTPFADLIAELGEPGVRARLRRGRIARCVTCRPTVVEAT